jgi:hypothetical protein
MKRRHVTLFALALALGLSSYFTEAVAEQRLGRLFYTPDQRTTLERQVVEDGAATADSRITINGRIIRSDGKSITWVNGTPDYDSQYTGTPNRHGKVGQSTDAGTGEVHDVLRGGSLVIERKPTH